ncbi:hypothetical protein NE237_011254 [Protea cynaroides]|uniref:Uncharacterized protein n=1 Tax=Protea cynaroides TaxID=273540 RepID=A0A9Q0GUL4_9MAGN|nr:hypothetical protein NE237_011254 [Protea cynaroides]
MLNFKHPLNIAVLSKGVKWPVWVVYVETWAKLEAAALLMAELQGRNLGGGNKKRTPTRLQRRAPASIEVNPPTTVASNWKVAIPLLSPLVLSPVSPNPKFEDRTADLKSRDAPSRQDSHLSESERPNFKSWQHPAAPFHYDPATPFMPSFVSRCR